MNGIYIQESVILELNNKKWSSEESPLCLIPLKRNKGYFMITA